jgi:hypothetical protein
MRLDVKFVSREGDPVAGYLSAVRLDELGGGAWEYSGDVGANGRGFIRSLRPGDYHITFSPALSSGDDNLDLARWYYPGVAGSLQETLTISGDTSVEGTVQPAGAIVGHGFGSDRISMGYRRVTATLYQDLGSLGWQDVYSRFVLSSGGFDFQQLFPGQYKVELKDAAGVFATTYYSNATSLTAATPVDLSAGGSQEITVTCSLDNRKVWLAVTASPSAPSKGKKTKLIAVVRDTHGWPLASRAVRFYRAKSSRGPWTLQGTGTTNKMGSCSVSSAAATRKYYYKAVYKVGAVTKTSSVKAVDHK